MDTTVLLPTIPVPATFSRFAARCGWDVLETAIAQEPLATVMARAAKSTAETIPPPRPSVEMRAVTEASRGFILPPAPASNSGEEAA